MGGGKGKADCEGYLGQYQMAQQSYFWSSRERGERIGWKTYLKRKWIRIYQN